MRAIDAGLPRTILVLGQKFAVKVTKNLTVGTGEVAPSDVHSEWAHEERMDVLGVCDRDHLSIELDPDTGWDRFRETFLHETLHAMISKASLNHDVLAGSVEENAVSRLAPILLQFLRENPKVIEFLTDRRLLGAGSAQV